MAQKLKLQFQFKNGTAKESFFIYCSFMEFYQIFMLRVILEFLNIFADNAITAIIDTTSTNEKIQGQLEGRCLTNWAIYA